MDLNTKLKSYLDSEQERLHIPGLDCSIRFCGEEIFRYPSGWASIEQKKPITKDTLYHIYSNTKVITCTAAMQLYERGKFLLEDPLSRFFPEMADLTVKTKDGVRKAEKQPTVRDLFRMTAGFGPGDRYSDLGMQFFQDTGGACPLVDFPKYLAQAPLEFEPGDQFLYGICHDVLGALIEKISGMTFGEYLKKNIFDPLGMKDSGFDGEALGWDRIADQYRWNGETCESLGNRNILVPPVMRESGGGGLICSVDDYMKFQAGLIGGKLLSLSTVDLMRRNQLSGSQWLGYGGTEHGMGYGLGVESIYDQALAGTPVSSGPFGWGGAAGSHSLADPERELCLFYAQAMFDMDAYKVYCGIRNIVYSSAEIAEAPARKRWTP